MAAKTETQYRILIMPDMMPYEMGDNEDEDAVNAAIERDGVWGFIVEARDVQGEYHTDWEHIDSCFGFVGADDYMLEQAAASIPAGTKDVPVYETDQRGEVGNGMPSCYVDAPKPKRVSPKKSK